MSPFFTFQRREEIRGLNLAIGPIVIIGACAEQDEYYIVVLNFCMGVWRDDPN